jgi:predicted nucleic acid-binding protein
MDNVLIDTDVILDFFFDRVPFSEFATEIFTLCENKVIKGFITPVILCNVYYILRKTARHGVIIDKLKQLLLILDVLKMDKSIVLDSLNSDFKDFEDALLNFSAIKNGAISIALTRNVKDYKKSDLAIMTPETYLKGQFSR